jgi:hypothetical protein
MRTAELSVPTARACRLLVALLAITVSLALATVGAIPGHDHGSATSHQCIVCQAGHLPCVTPAFAIELRAPVRVAFEMVSAAADRLFDRLCVTTPPRGPPV